MFYEAVGLMISADSDKQRREQYLVRSTRAPSMVCSIVSIRWANALYAQLLLDQIYLCVSVLLTVSAHSDACDSDAGWLEQGAGLAM